jgi:hypothetical protein
MSEYYNPSINYAEEERSNNEVAESLHESVQLMCQMWNDIAHEFDHQRSENALPFRQTSESAPRQTDQRSVQPRRTLCPQQVKNIVDTNMAYEPHSEVEFEQDTEPEEDEDNATATTKTFYDDIFELR